MLMRFEPFSDFNRMAEEMRSQRPVRQIPVDAYRRGDEFKIHLDLPGVDPDSIELTVENDVLTVQASRSWLPAEGDQVQITERAQGAFGRQLFLGQSLDRERLSATCENGVLTITIPVAEWSFLTNHARVLLCIAHDPGVRLRDIATALSITERTAYGIVTDLTAAGYVVKDKNGRRNRYQIQVHLPMREVVSRERTIGEVLELLVDTNA